MDRRKLLLVEHIISTVRAKRRLFSCFSLCFTLSLLTFYLLISITTSTEDTYTWFSSVLNAHNSSSSGPMMPNSTEKANIEKRRNFYGNITSLKRTSHQTNSTSAGKFHSPSKGGFVLGEKGSVLAVGKKKGVVVPKSCDIFDGRWVRDERKPYYAPGSCPYVDDAFNCIRNGRPDDGFMKWRWQPNDCNIPRLNATDFLERLRGKRLIFVGDSLNRNMWVSLLCILRQSVPNKKRVFEKSSRRHFKRKGYYSFKFKDYKCDIEYVTSTFLVREVEEKLRLDQLDEATSLYGKADIVVFNTGHWWNPNHPKTFEGKNYYQEGNYIHPVLKVNKAYAKALTTWAKWVDKNIDRSKTHVIFRGYSFTHFRGGQWNSGGQCHKDTEPIFNQTFLNKYPTKMRIVDQVLKQMKTPVTFLNISRLTDYRKDGHPSIYRRKYKTVQEKIAAEKFQDCSHWCLPGIPDAWNELLYASLLKDGKGSWRN